MEKSDLEKHLDRQPEVTITLGPRPHTVELVDEDDEDGLVLIRDKNGVRRLVMPRKDWEELKAYAAKEKHE